jgi:methylase of polypeptide subunit release factors
MIATWKIEFGDFQTPADLAREIAGFLRDSGEAPNAIVEPTCGRGNFIVAVIGAFPRAKLIHGFDINPQYVREAANAVREQSGRKTHLDCQNFFQIDWTQFFTTLAGSILVIGNPPWVTNSALGALGSNNLPEKTNFQGHEGFAAKTGKANFDISEWMLIRLAEALHRRAGCIAMLCLLDRRRSIIYEKRPRFSIFGVGDYTFSPWKVAISGLYKNCRFEVVGKYQGKPIVLDDTCSFIPCASEEGSRFVCELLNSDLCRRFLRSLVFFDAKRPITIDILNRIDLKQLAEHLSRAGSKPRKTIWNL